MADSNQDFLRNLLSQDDWLRQTVPILKWIGADAERAAALCAVFLAGPYRMTQRAAMPLGWLGRKRPALLAPHLPELVGFAKKDGLHDAVARNVLRILEETELPDELLGEIADLAFPLAADPQRPVAIRAFAMTVAARVCEKEPELAPELRLVIEDAMPQGAPGIKARGRRVLEQLDRLIPKLGIFPET